MLSGYVCFVGDVALDEYFRAPRWPSVRDKAMVTPLSAQAGGMIANAACVYAGYGGDSRLVSVLNSGAVSARLREHLAAVGVGQRYVFTDDSLGDSRTLIFLVDDEHTVLIPEVGEYQVPVSAECLAELRGAAYVYTTSRQLRRLRSTESDLPALDVARRLVGDGGTRLVLDLDIGRLDAADEAYLPLADVLLVNDVGFATYRGSRTAAAAAAELLALGVGAVVVTEGADGCSVYAADGRFSLPGLPVDVVDVTGAGDTFGSSLVYVLARTGDLPLAARFANAAAARSVTLLGPQAGGVKVPTVVEFMTERALLDDGDAARLTAPD